MKKTILMIMVALIAISVPAMAARVQNTPILHENFVYQAYCGETCDNVGNEVWAGYADPSGVDVITAVPGVLAIDPGGPQWPNFVSAAQLGIGTPPGPVAYTVTNVSMRKTVPTYVCTIPIGGGIVNQQGSANIRLWWPLMYEIPGTKWELVVTYKTAATWTPPGQLPATTHQDKWVWTVDANLVSLGNLIDLFHELPVGSCQVPLINGASLYAELRDAIIALKILEADVTNPDYDQNLSDAMLALILLIEDNCLDLPCTECPGQTQSGIRNTTENPACCKLLADADFILDALGVLSPSK